MSNAVIVVDNSFKNGIGGKQYNRFYDVNTHCPGFEDEVGRILAEYLGDRKGRVIDIGVGTGDTTAAILAHCKDLSVLAIDIEKAMFDVAAERFAGDTRVSLVLADALEALRWVESDNVDCVVSGFCLHNVPAKLRAAIMAEISRVLKPGGIFISCDKVALDDEPAHLQSLTTQILMFDGFADDPEYRRKWVEHYLVDDQKRFRITESGWKRLLKRNNFHSISFPRRVLMDVIFCAVKP